MVDHSSDLCLIITMTNKIVKFTETVEYKIDMVMERNRFKSFEDECTTSEFKLYMDMCDAIELMDICKIDNIHQMMSTTRTSEDYWMVEYLPESFDKFIEVEIAIFRLVSYQNDWCIDTVWDQSKRGEIAKYIMLNHKEYSGILFKMVDGKLDHDSEWFK